MPRRFQVTVDGHTYEVEVRELTDGELPGPEVALSPPRVPTSASASPAPVVNRPTHAPAGSVAAPLPGVALDVKVAVGDVVAAGDVLVILEAMKMENEITAPADGSVTAVHVQPGDSVGVGDALVTLEPIGR